jgi:hypothetical protein
MQKLDLIYLLDCIYLIEIPVDIIQSKNKSEDNQIMIGM